MARRPKPDRRRALELLAASRDGATEAILLAHSFSMRHDLFPRGDDGAELAAAEKTLLRV